jgi:hypothetical protein
MVLFWLDNPLALFQFDYTSKTGQLNIISLILIVLIFVMYFIRKEIILYLMIGLIIIAILYNCNIYSENFENSFNIIEYEKPCRPATLNNPYANLMVDDYNKKNSYSGACKNTETELIINEATYVPSNSIFLDDVYQRYITQPVQTVPSKRQEALNWLYSGDICKEGSILMNTPDKAIYYNNLCQGQFGAQVPTNFGYY